jgi:glycosyltransferase involved in cell wall biosynthesis
VISILTPVYQAARFLPGCIDSVARQAFPGLEHWIIDGGSRDGTVAILEEAAARHPHLRWISEPDKGQSHAMNKGIGLASNPIISFLNADDRYEPGALEFARLFFETHSGPAFLVGDCKVLREDGTLVMVNRPWPFDMVSFRLDYNFPFNPSAYFYHKSIHDRAGLYDESDHLTMDIDFICRLPGKARIRYEPRVLGQYFMIESSKTMQEMAAGRNISNLEVVFEKYWHRLPFTDRLRYRFWKSLGNRRGVVRYYLENPLRIFRSLARRAGLSKN